MANYVLIHGGHNDGDTHFGIMERCGAGYQKFGLVPDKPFVDTLAFDEEKIRTIPKTCIHYTKSEFLPVGKEAYADVLKNARRDHWAYYELECPSTA